jgi:HlyD family secretion protein
MRIGLNVSGLRRGGRRVWWLAGGVAVVLVLSGSVAAYALTSNNAAPASTAATARVDRGDVTLAIATTGALQPAQTRSLGFAVSGTVTEVKVRAGDQVTAGQLLAQLDPADAQAKVDSAQTALTSAQAALDTAEQIQATPTTASCASGGGTGGGGAATPTSTPSGSATPSSPTQSGSPGTSATPAPSASASAGQSGGPGPTTPSSRASQPGGSAQPAGGGTCTGQSGGSTSAGGTDPVLRAQQQVNSAQSNLATASDALAGTKITAPIAGKVLTVAGGVGASVDTSSFITLGDIAGMEVAASFPEADAGRLTVGLTAAVTLANRPGQEFPAKVTQVDPVGTASGQLVKYGALLSFDQVPADALVGQSANARVTVASVAGVLRVPTTAVHLTNGATSADPAATPAATAATTGSSTGEARVRTAAGGIESRQVTVGLRGDQYLEISKGLAEGEEVVLNW